MLGTGPLHLETGLNHPLFKAFFNAAKKQAPADRRCQRSSTRRFWKVARNIQNGRRWLLRCYFICLEKEKIFSILVPRNQNYFSGARSRINF